VSFVSELRRRKVFQVAVVYAVVAWLLVQVVATIDEPLGLPGWFDTAIIVLLAVGFPIALILSWAFDIRPDRVAPLADSAPANALGDRSGQRLNFALQGLVLIAVGFLVVSQFFSSPATNTTDVSASLAGDREGPIRRLGASLVSTGTIGNTGLNAHVAISPNGDQIVYAADVDGQISLYQRRLDQFETHEIPGTDFAQHPTFSPDGSAVAFVSDGGDQKLTTVNLATGRSRPIADAGGAAGIAWGTNGEIIFATPYQGGRALFRVSETGGNPERIEIEGLDAWPVWPHFLPGGESILLTLRPPLGNAADGSIAVLSLDTLQYQLLIEDGYNARYLPTGHIVFARDDSLWAASFDLDRLAIGPVVPLIDDVQAGVAIGGVAYSISNEGTLVYVPRQGLGTRGRQLVLVDQNGSEEVIVASPRLFERPRLSPDNRSVAVDITERGNQDIFVFDVTSGRQLSRVTYDPAADSNPLWDPAGEQLYFYSNRMGGGGPYLKSADGSGATELLAYDGPHSGEGIVPEAFTPDGAYLIYRVATFVTGTLGLISMTEPRAGQPLVLGRTSSSTSIAVSPDGNWIAYESNEDGGQGEIFITKFSDGMDTRVVSSGGGDEPVWPWPGDKLFYRQQNDIIVVDMQTEPELRIGDSRVFASFAPRYHRASSERNFDVERGGERVLLLKLPQQDADSVGSTQLAVIENWFAELRQIVPPLD